MKKYVAFVGLFVLVGGLMLGCTKENSCEKMCDDNYSGTTASQCKDACNGK